MQRLPCIDDVQKNLAPKLVDAFIDSGQVGGAIKETPVGFANDQPWKIALFIVSMEVDDNGLVLGPRVASLKETFDDRWDAVLITALAKPLVEGHIQIRKVSTHGFERNLNKMRPESTVSAAPILQLRGRRAAGSCFVFVGFAFR